MTPMPQTIAKETPLPADPEALSLASVEAMLLSSDRALSPTRIVEALGLEPKGAGKRISQAIDDLNAQYEQGNRSFRIERVAGGFRAVTLPEFAPVLTALHGINASVSLSRAAIESLSIIAYRQPITRAQIEAIRGVSSGEVIKTLLERRLVEITGRAEELGRPMLYGTSKRFCEVFGLASVKDLPPVDDLAPSLLSSGPSHANAQDPGSENS